MVELLMTVTVASVVILAATMAATSMFKLSQGQARQGRAEAQLALATAALDRIVASTGAGFANARYSFRVRNNVATGTLPGDTSGINVVEFGSDAVGIIVGTDVLEVAWGNPALRRAGLLVGTVNSASTVLQLQNGEPFAKEEWSGDGGVPIAGMIVLLTRDANPREACVAQITGLGISTNTVNVQMLNDNFGTTSPTCVLNNEGDTYVYKLEERRRIFVYQPANRADIGLYMQRAGANGVFGPNVDAIAMGVDNMQFAVAVGAEFDGGAVTVDSCLAGDGGVCQCGTPGLCVLGVEGGIGAGNVGPTPLNALIRGATIQLSVQGERRDGAFRPALMDSAAGPVDDIRRAQGQSTFNLFNAYLATQ